MNSAGAGRGVVNPPSVLQNALNLDPTMSGARKAVAPVVTPEITAPKPVAATETSAALAPKVEDLFSQKQKAESELAKAQADEQKALLAGKAEVSRKFANEAATKTAEAEKELKTYDAFQPSQETQTGLATMFALTNLAAFMSGGSGRYAGMAALSNMTNAMKGYQAGRKDVFDKEMKEYDKNISAVKLNNEKVLGDLKRYMEQMPKNKEAAMDALLSARANAGDSITAMKIRAGDIKGAYDHEQKRLDALTKQEQAAEALRSKEKIARERFNQQERLAKEKAVAKESGGKKPSSVTSALLAGRAENIREAFAQAAQDVINITKFPPGTMLGTFAGLTGATGTTLIDGIRNATARALSSREERALQQLVAGIEGHLAFALGGGYAASASKARMDQYKAQIAQSGDDPVNAALFLARLKQEMGILADNFASKPGATPEMNAAVQKYNTAINTAIPFTVEDVIESMSEKPKTQMKSFKTAAEADAAFQRKEIKKGDKIIVGGQSGTYN